MGTIIRKDPVKFRVAIPAADPPDNNMHERLKRPTACCSLLWIFNDFQLLRLSPPMVYRCRRARADMLAGIVVALALIPEAIGFSIIAGVDPRVGLYARSRSRSPSR